MSSLRVVSWNCRSGSLASRVDQLSALAPDISFIQEWHPELDPLLKPACIDRKVNRSKGVALVAHNSNYKIAVAEEAALENGAVIRAVVTEPIEMQVLGIWAQAPYYARHVIETLSDLSGWIRQRPTIVFGDLNSGTDLGSKRPLTKSHAQVVDAFNDLGLISAYHAFHGLEHANERHATYYHQFNPSQPWHIDFAFIPNQWTRHMVATEVLDGEDWIARSDHRPVLLELDFAR